MSYTDISLPQDTRLYQVINGAIAQPRLSVLSFLNTATADGTSYSNLQNYQYLFELTNQNTTEMYLQIYDKNVSAVSSAPYYGLNGFDRGFVYRFLNLSAPTVCFLPIITATDNGSNVTLNTISSNTYTITSSSISANVSLNNYILLTNQSTLSQNQVYRVTAINGGLITIYSDPLINTVLSQNQLYIFTRAKIVNSSGTYYYGLYNTGGYSWVSQTSGLQLQTADFGIVLNSELSSNQVALSIFTNQNLSVSVGQYLAINIATNGSGSYGGKTTGIYQITKIINNLVYFQPVYPPYVFCQQFVKVNYDLGYSGPAIWIVDPSTVGATNYSYSSVNFAFIRYNLASSTDYPNVILNSPSLWGQQVGGANDTILGFTLYTALVNNNYIKHSDIFTYTIQVPTWATNLVSGLQLNVTYNTNMLQITEQAVIT